MRLARFRIQNYKIIDDTDWVTADNLVTALVGKNESGKTAILRALWKTRNVSTASSARFDKLRDYPLDRYTSDRNGTQEVTALEFSLSDDEAQALDDHLDLEKKATPKVVRLHTFYKGKSEIEQLVQFEESVEKLLARPAELGKKAVDAVEKAITSAAPGDGSEAIRKARAVAVASLGDVHLWSEGASAALTAFEKAVKAWQTADEANAGIANKEIAELEELAEEARSGDPAKEAREWALEEMPAFIYFDDYGQLDTRIHLPTYLHGKGAPNERTRTQMALFDKTSLDPQELLTLGRARADSENDEAVRERKEERRILLESASFSISGSWVDWWPEKQHQLHFDADGEDLVLLVADEHSPFRIPFAERSHGFKWFFSFYLVFLVESQRAHKGAILLLDEPGLHIHPTLQAKLLDLFDLMSEENQLLYSTHLPFLIDGDHLERVRTVYRSKADPKHAVVSANVRMEGDRDTLFPLQAAIGYSIAQTLFLGRRSVIVEGITDYWILKALDACLRAIGDDHTLHPDTILIPAGGTRRLMPLASIMFADSGVGDQRMLVLLDSDTEGGEATKKLKRDLFADDASRVLHVGEAIGEGPYTIEDLVNRDEYLAAVKASGRNVALNADEQSEAAVLGALNKAFARKKWGDFGLDEKVKAALQLVNAWGKDPKSCHADTIARAADLFARINARFD